MQQFAMKEKDVKKKYGWMMPYPSSISKFSSPHPLTHRPTVREETRQSKPKIQYCSNIQQSLVVVLSQKEEEARSVRLIDSIFKEQLTDPSINLSIKVKVKRGLK